MTFRSMRRPIGRRRPGGNGAVYTMIAVLAHAMVLLVGFDSPARAQAFGTLVTCAASAGAPEYPVAAVVQAKDGNFYGTTSAGGAYGFGTVFKMDSAGNVSVLHAFGAASGDGQTPYAALLITKDGTFYGTTYAGGAYGSGTVFKMDDTGVVTVLHSFGAMTSDGRNPHAGLIQTTSGFFIGTTVAGGANGYGTVFSMDTTGQVTLLHSFGASANDGQNPQSALIAAKDGSYYGTTYGGGANSAGTAFKMDRSGNVTLLHSFGSGASDGQNPQAALTAAHDGTFYGTTLYGGAHSFGMAFKMDSAGNVTVLHDFGDTTGDGQLPGASLIQTPDGAFYGTTLNGGVYGFGTAFKMADGGRVTVLHSFGATNLDGHTPQCALLQAANRSLYGACSSGGADSGGTVFRIKRGVGFDAADTGYSDLLFRNTASGDVVLWEMNGLRITQQAIIAPGVALQWQVAGFGDFNGDGASDVLWRNSQTGDVYVWELNGYDILDQGYLAFGLPLVWQVVGVGDFDGDCRSDILWRNTQSGDVVLWEMDGLSVVSEQVVFAGLPLVWQVAGIGDFNGDGMADVLWRNTQSGDVVIWEMNGPTIVNQSLVFQALPLVWQVAGVGDFDGDCMDDILWRQSQSGDVVLWQMNGVNIARQTIVAAVGLTWQVVGVADLSGDGYADVVWRTTNGNVGYLWEMNGSVISNQGYLFRGLAPVWQIAAP